MIHGIPEMAGYFVGGLAGGIISSAFINHDLGTENMEKIVIDASTLISIAIGILAVAALIEVSLTPFIVTVTNCWT
jgi:uncharacterized membrane protein SpoIIM required for sporulation